MRRRELIALLGGAAITASSPIAFAQQPALPVVGYLTTRAANEDPHLLDGFRSGLGQAGYVEGRNVAIEYRWAEGQFKRLPELAADLVRRRVNVIAALSGSAAAKAATTTIPIVFELAGDPVEFGLVASLSRPGGNLTGVTTLSVELVSKRLELLHEAVPTATTIALLANPTGPNAETLSRNLQAAARTLGLQLHVLHASSERDFDVAFATLAQLRVGGLVVGTDAFFTSHSESLGALVRRHAVPTIYQYREFAAAGGLMSYGSNLADAYRQAGIYVGRILKGESPADLPVQQSTKVELIINLATAKALGITFPLTLLGRADEVIE
jgi:putative ABC transport system substrate-binding protein